MGFLFLQMTVAEYDNHRWQSNIPRTRNRIALRRVSSVRAPRG